jgi:hypothetical protein
MWLSKWKYAKVNVFLNVKTVMKGLRATTIG